MLASAIGRPSTRRGPRHLRWAVLLITALAMFLLPHTLSSYNGDIGAYSLSALGAPASTRADELPPPTEVWRSADHLIVVAGHAVYVGADRSGGALDSEESWYLEDYQRGQVATMLEHIAMGVRLAAEDNNSILLFSGGQTRARAGPRSEALSYWEAAEARGWFGHVDVRDRAQLEDQAPRSRRDHTESPIDGGGACQARDSFENLLFAICRFAELASVYPSRVTVVSFGFKRRRFEELHRRALRIPRAMFHFVGADPPDLPVATRISETTHSTLPYEHDPYGCHDAELRTKRSARNPFRRTLSFARGCPALAPLLDRCPTSLYTGALPWVRANHGLDEDATF